MTLQVYLSGEIHTDWREQIITAASGLDVVFNAPVTDQVPVMIVAWQFWVWSLTSFGTITRAQN